MKVVSSLLVVLAAATSTLACGPQVQVKTVEDHSNRVASHASFAFGAEDTNLAGYTKGEATPDVLAKVRAEIDAGLVAKGYAQATGEASELLIHVAAGTKQVIDQPSAGAMRAGASGVPDTERGIAIQIVHRGTGDVLYHAFARYDAEPKVVDAEKIHAAVTSLLSNIPRRAAK